jgi:nicotinamide phosphoribosyltransferase
MNDNFIQFFDTDSYKVSQHKQYPEGMNYAMAYIEARGGTDAVKFFGLQYILKQLKVPTEAEVEWARSYAKMHFGRDDVFNYEGWTQLSELGYFPLKIKAVKEGTVVPAKECLVTVENTHPDFAWLVSWFETQFVRVWYPTTVATISYDIKKMINYYLEKNGTPGSMFKLHDFGSRGVSSSESAMIGGMAHLLNFAGTDTLAAYMGAVEYYNANPETLAFSVPASEHSTITSWGADFEIDAFRNMIKQFGAPGAIYACVSDSYNIWDAIRKWKDLEPDILEQGGTLVIRPDSGCPVATPVKVVQLCIETFGATLNDKGYLVLPDHIRVIQGDGVEWKSIHEIYDRLDDLQISSDNIGFGMGGALLQKMDRDTFKFAMKMCYCEVNGEGRDVYKNPITDNGKKSKSGKLTLNTDLKTVTLTDDVDEVLVVVYNDGIVKEWDFEDIRSL